MLECYQCNPHVSCVQAVLHESGPSLHPTSAIPAFFGFHFIILVVTISSTVNSHHSPPCHQHQCLLRKRTDLYMHTCMYVHVQPVHVKLLLLP